jgi:hypothetical protein
MAVSKFVHFYNPGLFPIYDTEVVWKRVFSGFMGQYRSFCAGAGFNAGAEGAGFLRNYITWGSSFIQSAHPKFMTQFAQWLGAELPPRRVTAIDPKRLERLYATAFEFTAIGAAIAEGY